MSSRTAKLLLAAGLLLLVWHVGESLRAHPDYLPDFNQIARGREREFLLDSNLDWGQDLARLGRWMRESETPSIILRYFGHARPDKFDVNTSISTSGHRGAGLFAVSINYLMGLEGSSAPLRVLAAKEPLTRVGKSIWIYRIHPAELPDFVPPWFFEQAGLG